MWLYNLLIFNLEENYIIIENNNKHLVCFILTGDLLEFILIAKS